MKGCSRNREILCVPVVVIDGNNHFARRHTPLSFDLLDAFVPAGSSVGSLLAMAGIVAPRKPPRMIFGAFGQAIFTLDDRFKTN